MAVKMQWHQIADRLRGSYWFLPGIMAGAAIMLALVLPSVDRRVGGAWLNLVPWLSTHDPSGARAVLSTVAGSMITVAGVTFSITIATVANTASQFGPRLLQNFMRDRGNQITLGTFIAIFLYCILVLRTVRGGGAVSDGEFAFVPEISVLVALVLAVAGVVVLIFFIHHVPEKIYVSNLVADLGCHLKLKLNELFPVKLGRDSELIDEPIELPPCLEPTHPGTTSIRAAGDGYVQYVDEQALLDCAVETDILIHLLCGPGDFMATGQTIARVHPAAAVDSGVEASIRAAFACGNERTPAQDVMFLVDELVEVAARALSPGVNDPFTAMGCMDWLGAGVVELSSARLPSRIRHDEDGEMRIVANHVTFEGYCEAFFGGLRWYAAQDRHAARHLLRVIGRVSENIEWPTQRALLVVHAKAIVHDTSSSLGSRRDVEAIERLGLSVIQDLESPVRSVALEQGEARAADPGRS